MGWKLSNIQDKVRALTGRASTNQLSDTDLTTYINQYYQYVLPADLKPLELETWWEFDTTDGDETQVLDDDSYVVISSPAYADGYDVELYFDAERFYAKWPEHTTYDENIPTDALFYGQTLLLRPTPDTAYSMKIKAWTRPAALASSTSTPTLEGWGPLIAYGTAMAISEDNGDTIRVQEIMPIYQMELNRNMRKSQQQLNDRRTFPKF